MLQSVRSGVSESTVFHVQSTAGLNTIADYAHMGGKNTDPEAIARSRKDAFALARNEKKHLNTVSDQMLQEFKDPRQNNFMQATQRAGEPNDQVLEEEADEDAVASSLAAK